MFESFLESLFSLRLLTDTFTQILTALGADAVDVLWDPIDPSQLVTAISHIHTHMFSHISSLKQDCVEMQ